MRITNILLTFGLIAAFTQAIAIQVQQRAQERKSAYLNKQNNLLKRRQIERDEDCSDENNLVAYNVAPNDDTPVEIPVNGEIHQSRKNKHHSESNNDFELKVNSELIGDDAGKNAKSGNLVNNEGQPKLKFVIPIQRTGEDPEDIVAPLNIDQSQARAKVHHNQKQRQYRKAAWKNQEDSNDDRRSYIRVGNAY